MIVDLALIKTLYGSVKTWALQYVQDRYECLTGSWREDQEKPVALSKKPLSVAPALAPRR